MTRVVAASGEKWRWTKGRYVGNRKGGTVVFDQQAQEWSDARRQQADMLAGWIADNLPVTDELRYQVGLVLRAIEAQGWAIATTPGADTHTHDGVRKGHEIHPRGQTG